MTMSEIVCVHNNFRVSKYTCFVLVGKLQSQRNLYYRFPKKSISLS